MERTEPVFLPKKDFRERSGANINNFPFERFELEANKLPDYEEPGSFYRGLNIKDALLSLFGKLKLEAEPDDLVGTRDNATINAMGAIAYGRAAETKDGKKFICAIGFDPLPETHVEPSRLGR